MAKYSKIYCNFISITCDSALFTIKLASLILFSIHIYAFLYFAIEIKYTELNLFNQFKGMSRHRSIRAPVFLKSRIHPKKSDIASQKKSSNKKIKSKYKSSSLTSDQLKILTNSDSKWSTSRKSAKSAQNAIPQQSIDERSESRSKDRQR